MPVPQPTDKSETSSLPDPELNPLLHPLLKENLERWAEVYLSIPPEKRGEAVSELLRELQNSSAAAAASVPVIPDENRDKKAEAGPAVLPPTAAEALRTCSACAHCNSATQNFCGMCGAPLQISPEFYPSKAADDLTISAASLGDPSVR